MLDKVERLTDAGTHAGAAITIGSFFTWDFWNENSAAIVAIAAAGGLLLSTASFVIGLIHKKRKRAEELGRLK